jgi:hypothetical protein
LFGAVGEFKCGYYERSAIIAPSGNEEKVAP